MMEKELFNSVVQNGTNAIKSIFLLNGGACIAVLTILSRSDIGPELIRYPLLMFGMGAAAAALGSGLGYLTQVCYHNEFAARACRQLVFDLLHFRQEVSDAKETCST